MSWFRLCTFFLMPVWWRFHDLNKLFVENQAVVSLLVFGYGVWGGRVERLERGWQCW